MSYVGNKPAQTTIPADDAVTTAMLKDDAVTSAKIDDLTIVNADINASAAIANSKMASDTTSASNISTGTLGSARMGSGTASSTTVLYGDGTWKAEPVTNTSGLRNDISTLALHSAIADNKAAFNLTNAFIDQYEDSTGIDVLTACTRNAAGEYVYAATSTSEAYHINSAGVEDLYGGTTPTFSGTNDSRTTMSGASAMNSFSLAQPSVALPNDGHFTFELTLVQVADPSTLVVPAVFKNDPVFNAWTTNAGGTHAAADKYWGSTTASVSDKIKMVYDTADPGVITSYEDTGSGYGSASTVLKYAGANFISAGKATTLYFAMLAYKDTATAWIWDTTCTRVYLATGATGNYTSTTETANATVSKMGVVVLYKNEAGTATLDTDLIVEVSADGGSNYVSAPLTAAGTFSTGILSAKSNDITISNTGTAPKYKISFANQSVGVKETQVHGVALLY